MTRLACIACALALVVLGWAMPAPAQKADARPGPFKVLIVQSYNPEFIWTHNVNIGIREALEGLPVTFEVFYMDAKRRPAPAQLRARTEEALRLIEKLAPDVVVTVDDVAQEYLVKPYLKSRASPQVIFCGVNAPLTKYEFPTSNVSGVRERWHYREGIALLKRLVPSLKTVAVLGDASETGLYVSEDLLAEKNQIGPYPLELVGVENVRTFQEWQRRVLYYQKHADALALTLYHTLSDERTGRTVPPDEVMAWTNAHNDKPTLGFFESSEEHGMLCGVLESGTEQGYLAGQMVRTLLMEGGDASSLPVRANTRGVIMVNVRTAEKLKLHLPYDIIEAAGVVLQ